MIILTSLRSHCTTISLLSRASRVMPAMTTGTSGKDTVIVSAFLQDLEKTRNHLRRHGKSCQIPRK